MIAYNKIWLANLRLQDEVEIDVQQGNITPDEFIAIQTKYLVGFYTPNLFVRIGLFLLTCVIVLFGDGMLSLMAASGHIVDGFGWLFFLGLLSYAGLEIIVNNNNHYRSGVDDASLFITQCLFIAGFAIMLSKNDGDSHYLSLSGLIFLLTLYFSIRFTDMLSAAIACISFFAWVFFSWTKIVPGLSTVPFVMMLVTGGVYWLAQIYGNRKELINYNTSLTIVKLVSLLAFYASGNYYIIQTLSAEMTGKTGPVPFGMIFWIWTILLPFAYIAFGIKKKNAILLRVGLLLIAAAVITFRTYYHVLPVDTALTIAGALVLGIVYGVTRYLKTPKHGFTRAEPGTINSLDHLKIESLIVAETFSHTPTAPANDGVKFGGGDFGGGGSSGDF
ncbi:MAG: hypothetical protein M3O71_23700 [Bacteroidota bacterium]|nr:hypothetical protein [Bacteroidota bacterium]